jgi:asparagine synthase (glutamine-hydrolysing)
MCGISGLILSPRTRVDASAVRERLRMLEHRGPDDLGVLALCGDRVRLGREVTGDFDAEVVLEHRRLSIIDLSEAGWQPMGTPDGRHYIIFNGEIYNYLELREQLEHEGVECRSRSDTEVLLRGYAHWGPSVLHRVVGMFAFALLDVRDRKLFLARDQFGIKPLFYAQWRDGFAFASEMAPLLELPGVRRIGDPQRIYNFLRFGITDIDGETLIRDIRQVPAAHFMEIPLDAPRSVEPKPYWQLDPDRRSDASFAEASDHVRRLFLRNVEIHLRSDVPVGAALSGGIDSSAVVAAIRHLQPDAELHTFSFVADNPALSEEKWVDIAGKAAGATIHKVRADPASLVADLDSVITAQGECFGGTSIYAQRQVFRKAREQGIKVMLDGQGADEIMGGYHAYLGARLASLLRQGRYFEAMKFSRRAGTLPKQSPARVWARAMDFLLPSRLQLPLRRLVRRDLDPAWLDLAWLDERGVQPRSVGYVADREVLRAVLRSDLVRTSLPRLLRFEDRNSMAFSIESRVPFLTPELVEFVFSLPENYLVADDGTTKAVFRSAMRGLVPDAILDRKDKIGFETPERDWMGRLRPWVEGILSSETARHIGAFRVDQLLAEWGHIVAERRPFDQRVWRWVSFIRWVERWNVVVA